MDAELAEARATCVNARAYAVAIVSDRVVLAVQWCCWYESELCDDALGRQSCSRGWVQVAARSGIWRVRLQPFARGSEVVGPAVACAQSCLALRRRLDAGLTEPSEQVALGSPQRAWVIGHGPWHGG
jgi:hypothetical protein